MDPSCKSTINDCIHGHILFSRDLIRIVNTPEVQRLRDLKQLGLGSHVYPGATHTRFAHSIGVCHLAGTFVRQLKARQPELPIDDDDIFCVQVAGLCHDLGHGPFSHMFQDLVKEGGNKDWQHEHASKKLLEKMVKDNGLEDLLPPAKIKFIQELIHSEKEEIEARSGEKEFLYEIVSNERTGLDVDKFDYFARDCHALGLSNMFDHNRFMLMARALPCEDGKVHICHKDKELDNLIVMFQTRFTLHMFAYKHRVVCALDKMVSDAFSHADKYLETQGDKDDERTYSLTKCTENMGAFIRLNDSVLHRIRDFPLGKDPQKNQHIEAARLLVERIDKRRLYKLVHEIKNYNNQEAKMTGKQIEEEIVTLGNNFEREDIYVQVAKFDFGMGEENPLKYLNVFSKTDPDKAFPYNQNMVSKLLLPGIFSEKIVRVYCKAEDECKKTAIKEAAVKWEEKLTAATSAKQGN